MKENENEFEFGDLKCEFEFVDVFENNYGELLYGLLYVQLMFQVTNQFLHMAREPTPDNNE